MSTLPSLDMESLQNTEPVCKRPLIVGLGESLWDLLPEGRQLGGAPANFAYHAHALGAEAWPVTCVGADALGDEIRDRLTHLGLSTEGVSIDSDRPTGTVSVELLPDGQHRFTIHENVAWDRLVPTDAARYAVARADALCFGTLGQRCDISRRAIQSLVASTPAACLRIFDINLRQHFYSPEVIEKSLQLANVLKINDQELPVLASLLRLSGSPANQMEELSRRYNLMLAALTCGDRGSLIYAGGQTSSHPGLKTDVVDSIGAGDAFTAALALGLLAGWDLQQMNLRANEVAAYVCSKRGATPSLPRELKESFSASHR